MNSRYLRLPSRHLNREVHLWTYGWFGQPVLVFPSASGMAHEWQQSGAIAALRPLLEAGRIKLYCPETNVSRTFNTEGDPRSRLGRHRAYENFVIDELLPWIYQDCEGPLPLVTTGCSFGAYYAVTMALKHPERFRLAAGFSGRYRIQPLFNGYFDDDVYFNDPNCFVPNLSGQSANRVRKTGILLVVGRGPHEGRCIPETLGLAQLLDDNRIPHALNVWGDDAAHHWFWWKKQITYYFGQLF